ncbi:U6 snRNA phosphodiesterase Usb1 [Xylariomycetidae sp. FL0641]|nr:U6 snRNA phosphodiesterase Usb1 [Xylariomycetidae sp. FL0641]
MALVDYSSDSESASDSDERQHNKHASGAAKRRKIAHDEEASTKDEKTASSLPPLPSQFHDLYASTVRVSTSDDPTLHQGRKRVNPHKAGNWPSHLYIEWHPDAEERNHLSALLANLRARLARHADLSSTTLTSLLTSDLGAPQPLHISLSRPIVLATPQRDAFVSRLTRSLQRSGVRPFALAPTALRWFRAPESGRAFLVLQVASSSSSSSSSSSPAADNPELGALLARCNAAVTAFGQPPLYAGGSGSGSGSGSAPSSARGPSDGKPVTTPSRPEATPGSASSTAFHVSLAWSFAAPTPALAAATRAVFDDDEEVRAPVRAMRVRVDGVKAKIGNAVTHVALLSPGRRGDGDGKGLFGI